MADIKHKYETIFILKPDLSEEDKAASVEKFTSLIEKNATLESVDDWGKRKLAYPINFFNEGYYTLVNFESNADFPAELDRIYNITDSVLRSIIVCKDAQ